MVVVTQPLVTARYKYKTVWDFSVWLNSSKLESWCKEILVGVTVCVCVCVCVRGEGSLCWLSAFAKHISFSALEFGYFYSLSIVKLTPDVIFFFAGVNVHLKDWMPDNNILKVAFSCPFAYCTWVAFDIWKKNVHQTGTKKLAIVFFLSFSRKETSAKCQSFVLTGVVISKHTF